MMAGNLQKRRSDGNGEAEADYARLHLTAELSSDS